VIIELALSPPNLIEKIFSSIAPYLKALSMNSSALGSPIFFGDRPTKPSENRF